MTSQATGSDELARIWGEHPDVIRTFIEIRPQYEQLCREIAYILEKRMKESEIEYSAITFRAKTLKSFAEKLLRKKYSDPLKGVTDLAGVRVVYLYKTDRPLIDEIIESEFTVIEKVDKVEEQEADRFGYGALHYLVYLGRKSSGARYDDLKSMTCEIQVRTVLQDAWAVIDHHLSYKQESDVPKILQRKLNSLSGLFETADDQFDRVRSEREQYKNVVKGKLGNKENFLGQEINFDTVTEFAKWKFPNKEIAPIDIHVSDVTSVATEYGYTRLLDLDALLERTKAARIAIDAEKPIQYSVSEVAVALALVHPSYRKGAYFTLEGLQLLEKYEHLVSQSPGAA